MVSKWELGQRPSPFWQEKLSELYGVSAEDLGFVKQPDALDASLNTSPPLSSTQTVLSSSSLHPHDGLTCALPEVMPVDEQNARSDFSPHAATFQRPGGGHTSAAPPGILRGLPEVPIRLYGVVDFLHQKSDAMLEQQVEAWTALLAGDFVTLFDLGWSLSEVLESLQVVLPEVQAMSKISRRDLFRLGAAAVVSSISIPEGRHVSAAAHADLQSAFGENIAVGWKLFHTAGNAQVLAVGQAQLYLVQQAHAMLPPRVRSAFYTSVYNLIGKAQHFQERFQDALDAHINAHVAALSSGDPWCVTQSLICQADSYQALGQHVEAIEAIEEALRLLKDPTDETLVRTKAHLLACWADNAMTIGEGTIAQEKLDASAQLLDQISLNEEFDRATWLQFAGKFALATGDHETAICYYEQALAELPPQWLIRQAFILTPLMVAYACMRDRTLSLDMAEKAVATISALNAPIINKQFMASVRLGLLEAFPNDIQIQKFVTGLPHRLPMLHAIRDLAQ